MPNIESLLKTNAQKLEFLKWFALPVLVAASFFFLDGRYISKDDWRAQNNEQKSMIMTLSGEQKLAFTGLTKAITALAEEQRNVAEFQRTSTTNTSALYAKLDKHEVIADSRWEKTNLMFDKIDTRIDRVETAGSRQDVMMDRNTDSINILLAKTGALETSAAKNDAGIQVNTEAIKQHIQK